MEELQSSQATGGLPLIMAQVLASIKVRPTLMERVKELEKIGIEVKQVEYSMDGFHRNTAEGWQIERLADGLHYLADLYHSKESTHSIATFELLSLAVPGDKILYRYKIPVDNLICENFLLCH